MNCFDLTARALESADPYHRRRPPSAITERGPALCVLSTASVMTLLLLCVVGSELPSHGPEDGTTFHVSAAPSSEFNFHIKTIKISIDSDSVLKIKAP